MRSSEISQCIFHYEIPLIFESISTKTSRVEFAYIKDFNNVWVLYLVFRLTCYNDVYRFNRVSRNGLLEKITAEMKFHWNYGFKKRRMRASLFTWVADQTNYFFEHKTWNDFLWFLSNGYFKSSNELNYQNVQHLNYSIILLKCFEPVQQPWSYGGNTTRPFKGFDAFQTLFQKMI